MTYDKYFVLVLILVIILYLVVAHGIDVAIIMLIAVIPLLYIWMKMTPENPDDKFAQPPDYSYMDDYMGGPDIWEGDIPGRALTEYELDSNIEDNEIYDIVGDVLNRHKKPTHITDDPYNLMEDANVADSIYGGEFDREMAGGVGLSLNDQIFRRQRIDAKRRERHMLSSTEPNNIYHKLEERKRQLGVGSGFGLANEHEFTYEPIYI